jgi:hypothetical protein
MATRYNGVGDDQAQADLRALPGHLHRIEGWMDEGVLGHGSPNAADLQVGAGVRLLGTFGDLRPLLAGRPCVRLGENGFAPPVGAIPAGTLPSGWVCSVSQR